MVSCSNDGVIAVTDLTTGDCVMSLRGHKGAVLAVAFDRSKIISAGDDDTLRIWVWASRGPKQASPEETIYEQSELRLHV